MKVPPIVPITEFRQNAARWVPPASNSANE